MSDSAFVVMPIRADGSTRGRTDTNEVAEAIEQSIHEKLHPPAPEPIQDGPLKKAMANSDSLYKYISWSDPLRTLGSYIGLMALLFGIHYSNCTSMLLKIGAGVLGVVSFTSLVSRSTKNDFIARMRPEYKEIPESTLNATLKDIHDLLQYLVIQAQRIMYGEDLGKTFAACLGFTSLFWLLKFLSPFELEVLGLSSAYIVPLMFTPRGREITKDAKIHAQELAQNATETAGAVYENGKVKVADLSNRTQQTAGDIASRGRNTASNLSSNAQQAAGSLASKSQQTASNISSTAQRAAGQLGSNTQQAASKSQQTASNISSSAQQTAGQLGSNTQQAASNAASHVQHAPEQLSSGIQNLTSSMRSIGQQTARDSDATHQRTAEDHSYDTQRFAGVLSPGTRQTANTAGASSSSKISSQSGSHQSDSQQAALNIDPRVGYGVENSTRVPDQGHVYHHHVKNGAE